MQLCRGRFFLILPLLFLYCFLGDLLYAVRFEERKNIWRRNTYCTPAWLWNWSSIRLRRPVWRSREHKQQWRCTGIECLADTRTRHTCSWRYTHLMDPPYDGTGWTVHAAICCTAFLRRPFSESASHRDVSMAVYHCKLDWPSRNFRRLWCLFLWRSLWSSNRRFGCYWKFRISRTSCHGNEVVSWRKRARCHPTWHLGQQDYLMTSWMRTAAWWRNLQGGLNNSFEN